MLLSDEEVREIAKQYDLSLAFPCDSRHTSELFARAIEAAVVAKLLKMYEGAALVQQEPVAVFKSDEDCGHVELLAHRGEPLKDGDKLFAAPVQQEPDKKAEWMAAWKSLGEDDGDKRISQLILQNKALLDALKDIAHGLEGARIWGGKEWKYNPLHPFNYLPLKDQARAAIAAVAPAQQEKHK